MGVNFLSDKRLANSISLEQVGVDEIGWLKKDVFEVLLEMREKKIAILGGDVYSRIDSNIESAYCNWSCEKESKESSEEFLQRSHEESIRYIQNYRDQEAVFVPVFGESMY